LRRAKLHSTSAKRAHQSVDKFAGIVYTLVYCARAGVQVCDTENHLKKIGALRGKVCAMQYIAGKVSIGVATCFPRRGGLIRKRILLASLLLP